MPSSKPKTAAHAISADRKSEIEALCRNVFGALPNRVAFPGGKHRSTFIANIGEHNYAVAKREDERAAALEGIVMKSLSKTGLVPALIAVRGQWIVQECLPGTRIPVVLDQIEDIGERELLIDQTINSLAILHHHAIEDRLQYRVGRIDAKEDWSSGHLSRPARISEVLGIAPPVFDPSPLAKRFRNDHRDFIKGDARPGNALAGEYGVAWIDWDGCGTRNALDDLVFILADEWTALHPDAEARLLQKYLPAYSQGRSSDEAFAYVMAYGVFHMCARIRRAIRYRQRDGKWWSREMCLLGDKIGVTKSEVGRMCERAQRWAGEVPEIAPLAPWFDQVMARLRIDPPAYEPAQPSRGGSLLAAAG